jgi:hypothetical protein
MQSFWFWIAVAFLIGGLSGVAWLLVACGAASAVLLGLIWLLNSRSGQHQAGQHQAGQLPQAPAQHEIAAAREQLAQWRAAGCKIRKVDQPAATGRR